MIVFLALVGSCSKAAPECVDHGDCPDGMGCFEEVCQEVGCLVSDDCQIGRFCNPSFNCQEGCESDGDCLAGETCNGDAHQCQSYGCRSTQLDCAYGEVCNAATARCEDAGGKHCETCNVDDGDTCGGATTCQALVTDFENECSRDTDCETGEECDTFQVSLSETMRLCHADYCFEECDSAVGDEDCPRGYQCTDFGGGTWYCFADCSEITG